MPDYPSLYEINTRVMLNELSSKLGRQATLDDFPDSELERLAKAGFKWIWPRDTLVHALDPSDRNKC